MVSIYRFKWPLIIISAGVILENLGIIMAEESFAKDTHLIGLWLKILGLVGVIWKLILVENK